MCPGRKGKVEPERLRQSRARSLSLGGAGRARSLGGDGRARSLGGTGGTGRARVAPAGLGWYLGGTGRARSLGGASRARSSQMLSKQGANKSPAM